MKRTVIGLAFSVLMVLECAAFADDAPSTDLGPDELVKRFEELGVSSESDQQLRRAFIGLLQFFVANSDDSTNKCRETCRHLDELLAHIDEPLPRFLKRAAWAVGGHGIRDRLKQAVSQGENSFSDPLVSMNLPAEIHGWLRYISRDMSKLFVEVSPHEAGEHLIEKFEAGSFPLPGIEEVIDVRFASGSKRIDERDVFTLEIIAVMSTSSSSSRTISLDVADKNVYRQTATALQDFKRVRSLRVPLTNAQLVEFVGTLHPLQKLRLVPLWHNIAIQIGKQPPGQDELAAATAADVVPSGIEQLIRLIEQQE